MMKRLLKAACATVACMALFTTTGFAGQVAFSMDYPNGFMVSVNGGPLAPSGPILVTGVVDTSTADINASAYHGEYPLTSATFTGAGFLNRPITTALSLVTYDIFGPQHFAFQLTGQNNEGIMGWNGSTSGGDFMGNVNNLSTLYALPFTTAGTSTFWYDALGPNLWTLALGGDTIGANMGNEGPDGFFSIQAVPEPSTFTLLILGAAGVMAFCRRR